MSEQTAIERLLRRDYIITSCGLVVLVILSWVYIADGAGLGMRARDMSTFVLFPSHGADSSMNTSPMTASHGGTLAAWPLVVAMWWVMMIAMMAPSAASTILLYARVHRHSALMARDMNLAPTGAFLIGYLLVWLAFSIAAASLQWLLGRSGLVSELMMRSESRWLSGAVLIAAGLYQLSPFKGVCLDHCRSPTKFLTAHWRPGAIGAVRLGILHGAYCVGCCWMLMALLFVGGVMDLVWIAALSILVLAEKLTPVGPKLARGLGLVLLILGGATFSGLPS